jgi:hypothetical protein
VAGGFVDSALELNFAFKPAFLEGDDPQNDNLGEVESETI